MSNLTTAIDIAVIGNIGSGKTTTAKLISKHMGFNFAPENIVEDPRGRVFLNLFYNDVHNNVKPSNYAFLLQHYCLFTRGADHLFIQASGENWVQERTIFDDRYVFAEHLHNTGFIADEKFQDYMQDFLVCSKHISFPNLFIMPKASLHTLRQRIRDRNREIESPLTDPNNPYLSHIEELYDQIFDKLRVDYPNRTLNTLTIDTDQYNLESSLADKDEILRMIKLKL